MVTVGTPPAPVVSVSEVGADPARLVERFHEIDKRMQDLSSPRKGKQGSRPPRPSRFGSARTRASPKPQPGFKWGRIGLASGLAFSVANPFGGFDGFWRPIIAPLLPGGVFGRDEGLICYVSPCDFISSVVAVKAGNTCVPRTPQCPFGSVTYPSDAAGSYKAAGDAEFGYENWEADFPFANLIYIKTSFTPGFFVHEVQEMLPGTNVGVLPGPVLLMPGQVALGSIVPNPNLLPRQQPETKTDPKAEPKTQTQPQRSSRNRRRITVILENRINRRTSPAPVTRFPGPPKNDRKVQFSSFGAYRIVMGAIDTYTESQDLVRAIYRGLPCAVRSGSWKSGPKGGKYFVRSPGKKHRFDTRGQMETLAKHWDKVDISRAFMNVVENQVEDAVIGQQSRFMSDSLRARQSWDKYAKFKVLQADFRRLSEEARAGAPSRHRC